MPSGTPASLVIRLAWSPGSTPNYSFLLKHTLGAAGMPHGLGSLPLIGPLGSQLRLVQPQLCVSGKPISGWKLSLPLKKKKIKKEKLIHSDLCSFRDTVQKMKRQTMKKIFANLIFQKESTKMCIKSFSRSFAEETYGWKTGMGNDVQWCWSSGKYKLRLQWGPHVPADLAGPAAGQDVERLEHFPTVDGSSQRSDPWESSCAMFYSSKHSLTS